MSDMKRVGPVTVVTEPGRGPQGPRPSQSPVYRNISGAHGDLVAELDGLKTPFEVFRRSVERYPDRPCLGWRPQVTDGTAGAYTYYTYKETDKLAGHVASGLVKLLPQSKVIGVWSVNCVEWMLTIRGAERNSAIIVPMYDSLGTSAIEYITRHSEIEIAVVQKEKMAQLADLCEKNMPTLRGVISIGEVDAAIRKRIENRGIKVLTFAALMELGKANTVDPTPPGPEDICCIMYTSGTSGTPKGVVLHHRAVVSGIAGAHDMIAQTKLGISCHDSLLSYMPLAHIFDRLLEEFALSVGARIGWC